MQTQIRIPASPILLATLSWVGLTIIFSYVISAATGHSPVCNPFIDGCTTISSTGMHYPAAYFYDFGLIAGPALMSVTWLLIAGWLSNTAGGKLPKPVIISIIASTVGVFSLSLGEAFLPIEIHTKQIVHVAFTAIFFLTHILSVFYLTFFISYLKAKGTSKKITPKLIFTIAVKEMPLKIVCIIVLVFLTIVSLQSEPILNDKAVEWCASFAILFWVGSFYRNLKGYYLTVGSGDDNTVSTTKV